MEVLHITRVVADDWQGFYVNTELFLEGQNLNLWLILNRLEGKLVSKAENYSLDRKTLEEQYGGLMPRSLFAFNVGDLGLCKINT